MEGHIQLRNFQRRVRGKQRTKTDMEYYLLFCFLEYIENPERFTYFTYLHLIMSVVRFALYCQFQIRKVDLANATVIDVKFLTFSLSIKNDTFKITNGSRNFNSKYVKYLIECKVLSSRELKQLLGSALINIKMHITILEMRFLIGKTEWI